MYTATTAVINPPHDTLYLTDQTHAENYINECCKCKRELRDERDAPCAMIGAIAPIDLRIRDDGSSSLSILQKSHSILSERHYSHDDLLLTTGNNGDTLQSACCDKHVGDGSKIECLVYRAKVAFEDQKAG